VWRRASELTSSSREYLGYYSNHGRTIACCDHWGRSVCHKAFRVNIRMSWRADVFRYLWSPDCAGTGKGQLLAVLPVCLSRSPSDIEKLLPEDVFRRLRDCQPDPTLDSKERKCESVLLRDGKTGETMVEPHFPGIRRLNIQKTKNMWAKNVNVKVHQLSNCLFPSPRLPMQVTY
jgi:hypothetical protein